MIAPALYRLAFRKKLTVRVALNSGTWMRGLQRMSSVRELDQFITLWTRIQEVTLTNEPDSVRWNISADGQYSACSAYQIYFSACIKLPELERTLKIKAEGKIKFSLWLLLQNRLWNADRLRNRGWNPNDTCFLCDKIIERAYSRRKYVMISYTRSHNFARSQMTHLICYLGGRKC